MPIPFFGKQENDMGSLLKNLIYGQHLFFGKSIYAPFIGKKGSPGLPKHGASLTVI